MSRSLLIMSVQLSGYRYQGEWSVAKSTDKKFRIAIRAINLGGAGFFHFEGDQTGILHRSFTGRTADRKPAGKYQVAEVFNGVIADENQTGEQVSDSSELAD